MSYTGFVPSSELQVWSCGGGRQSNAIAALICTGQLPKPHIALMVDTGREKSRTFRYLNEITIPNLRKAGVELIVIPKADFATVDLTRTTKAGDSYLLIPAFTNQSGEIGKLPNYCTGEWKRDVIARYLRTLSVERCDLWIGFSTDEYARRGGGHDKPAWAHKVYPLACMGINVMACEQIVLNAGWPRSPSSSCWMCPNMCDRQWREMKRAEPDDFRMACSFDDARRLEDPNVFLHQSCKPLRDVDFENREPSMFGDECPSGLCFV